MQIALDIIHGLDYLHSQGVAHLDLKSPNVLIDRDGTAKIADVGLSKLVGTREATATSAGSLLWAAPEQIEMKVSCSLSLSLFSSFVYPIPLPQVSVMLSPDLRWSCTLRS